VEGKHRFFAWLLLQSKLLTADKLLLHNCPATPYARFVIKCLKPLNTCACTASSRKRFGYMLVPGQEGWSLCLCRYLHLRAGGIRPSVLPQRKAKTCFFDDLLGMEYWERKKLENFRALFGPADSCVNSDQGRH
jgi:hypothetical protein